MYLWSQGGTKSVLSSLHVLIWIPFGVNENEGKKQTKAASPLHLSFSQNPMAEFKSIENVFKGGKHIALFDCAFTTLDG
jgi:hypothetical protein